MSDDQEKATCPYCQGVGVYDKIEDRFFCMDCGFDSDDVEIKNKDS